MPQRIRLPGLDLLRFLAALIVVGFHYIYSGMAITPPMSPVGIPALHPLAAYGYVGVPLFFIISGFVICWSIERHNTWDFMRARFLRLAPAFFVCVTVTALVVALWGAPRYSVSVVQYLGNLTFFSEVLGFSPIDGVYWTLQVEWIFYLAIAAGIFSTLLPRFIIPFTALWLLACGVFSFTPEQTFPLQELATKLILTKHAPFFVIGILLALLMKMPTMKSAYILLFPAVFLASHSLVDYAQHQDFLPIALNSTLMAVMPFILVMLTVGCIWWPRWGCPDLLKTCGNMTYPLYLLHSKIGFIFFLHFSGTTSDIELIVVMTILALAGAYVMATYVEPKLAKAMGRMIPKGN